MNLLLFLAVSSWHVARCIQPTGSQHVFIDNQRIDDARATSEREMSFSLDLYKAVANGTKKLFALSTADVFVGLSKLHSAATGISQQQLSNVLHYYPGRPEVPENGLRELVERMADLQSSGATMVNDVCYHYEPWTHQSLIGRNQEDYQRENQTSLGLAIRATFSSYLDLNTSSLISSFRSNFYLRNGINYVMPFTETDVEVNYGELKYPRDSNDGEATATYVGLTWLCESQHRVKTFFILPNERHGIAELERNINGTAIHQMISNTVEKLVTLILPGEIELESMEDLEAPLKNMGLTEMFNITSDFGNTFPSTPLKVGSVLHQAHIQHNWLYISTPPHRFAIPDGTARFVLNHPSMIITVSMDDGPLIIAMGRYAPQLFGSINARIEID